MTSNYMRHFRFFFVIHTLMIKYGYIVYSKPNHYHMRPAEYLKFCLKQKQQALIERQEKREEEKRERKLARERVRTTLYCTIPFDLEVDYQDLSTCLDEQVVNKHLGTGH